MDEHSDFAHIINAISAYVEANPYAADSQEGITRWWLRGQVYKEDVVHKALETLVKHGLLKRQINPDGAVIYASKKQT